MTRAVARNSTSTMSTGITVHATFHLIAAVDWRRFTAVVAGAPAEFRDRIQEQAENNRKNGTGDSENQQ